MIGFITWTSFCSNSRFVLECHHSSLIPLSIILARVKINSYLGVLPFKSYSIEHKDNVLA